MIAAKSHANIIACIILACTAMCAIGWSQLSSPGVALLVQSSLAFAAVPTQINHQGVVSVNGVRFNGVGVLRFALVNPANGNNVWTNDGSNLGNSTRPTGGVSLAVTNGLYSIRLGDTLLANMIAIPNDVLRTDNLRLRVWFDDGTGHGIQQLSPDQPVASAAYAIRSAGECPLGTIQAWHRNVGTTALPLPDGWMECNGDPLPADSPLRTTFGGTSVPNLNFETGYVGGRFLRGHTQSGIMQDSTLINRDISQGFLGYASGNTPPEGWMKDADATFDNRFPPITHYIRAESGAQPGRSCALRPVNMSVVWIMRVR